MEVLETRKIAESAVHLITKPQRLFAQCKMGEKRVHMEVLATCKISASATNLIRKPHQHCGNVGKLYVEVLATCVSGVNLTTTTLYQGF